MKDGFTLIELLVVILIIALLAAVLTPIVVGELENAKDTKAKGDIAILHDAIVRLNKDCKKGPFGRSILQPANVTAEFDFNNTTTAGLISNPTSITYINWRGPYLMERIAPDPWENPYYIDWYYPINALGATSGHGVVVLSLGPDGTTDTADDIFKHLLPNQ